MKRAVKLSANEERKEVPDGSGSKPLRVLDLFSDREPVLTVKDVCERLGYKKSAAYRYIRTLCNVGLLATTVEGIYSLGPRIVELERLTRLTDPVLQAGQTIMPAVAAELPNSIVLLCTLYDENVLCVHREGPQTLKAGGEKIGIVRERGVPLPLFQGAASIAILAFLPSHRIRSLYLRHQVAIGEAGLGATWSDFRTGLASIRRQGYFATVGRYNRLLAAVSVPVQSPDGMRVVGSLTRILPREDCKREAVLAASMTSAAARISNEAAKLSSIPSRGRAFDADL